MAVRTRTASSPCAMKAIYDIFRLFDCDDGIARQNNGPIFFYIYSFVTFNNTLHYHPLLSHPHDQPTRLVDAAPTLIARFRVSYP